MAGPQSDDLIDLERLRRRLYRVRSGSPQASRSAAIRTSASVLTTSWWRAGAGSDRRHRRGETMLAQFSTRLVIPPVESVPSRPTDRSTGRAVWAPGGPQSRPERCISWQAPGRAVADSFREAP